MVMVLSSGRCIIQDAPSSPASASAHGSRNKRSSLRLSLARTAAVQQAVAANVEFAFIVNPPFEDAVSSCEMILHAERRASESLLSRSPMKADVKDIFTHPRLGSHF